MMIVRKKSKMRLKGVVFGIFLAIMASFGALGGTLLSGENAYADPVENTTTTESNTENNSNNGNTADNNNNGGNNGNTADNSSNNANSTATTTASTGDDCKNSLGAIGWLVCPTTGAIAQGVDFLYGLIKDFLEIDPVVQQDGAPIYEIWKYCRGFANIVFIIFLLVVIYSQITGLGISNYGIKKALPKLIVVAILINLSFLICTIAVDVSNIVGESTRSLFDSVANSAVPANSGMNAQDMTVASAEMYSAMAGGAALTIGGTVIAFETGAIWMLIPLLLGAIVAVVTGLITIALRQAVVALLIMIAPLAIVAYMLPNTENLFTKWRKLLTQMLVFYPAFSLLFGAANLAGFAIIMSAKDGFGLLLGVAVQIFPLFFSWKLMQMSGTFLGTVNSKMREWGNKPVAGSRAMAGSMRTAAKMKHLASGRPTTPSLRLMQFMSDRRVDKEAEMAEQAELVKNRGLAYRARKNYDRNWAPNRRAEESYENQARTMEYQQVIERDKNNMNKGLGQLVASRNVSEATKARLNALDNRNVLASDALKFEQARGEKIAADNAEGFYKRTEAAMNWRADEENGYKRNKKGEYVLHNGDRIQLSDYKMHIKPGSQEAAEAAVRYNKMAEIMEGNVPDIHFAAASSAHAYDTQRKIIETKYQKYFEMLPPTKDVELRLSELTKMNNASNYIDAILPGLRVLNQRGDTDIVRKQMEQVLNSRDGIELGTHASQALASFLMFEVKDSDPFLRRFGKYINLETASVYNKNKRQNARLSLDEFVTGEYEDWEPGDRSQKRVGKSKKSIVPLMEGTPLDNLERTAYGNLDDMLKNAYTKNGQLDVDKYLARRKEIETATGPAFVSASLKYLSGSEQLKNAVSFLTGIEDDGSKRWMGDGDLVGNASAAEKYFRGRTMEYIKAQTPAQILGMRSDYKEALTEHLLNEYFEKNPDEREKYNNEIARIQNAYGDEDAATAEKKRKADTDNLRMDFAGRQMRQILGDTGKLEQIYKTRRSGAANNAKDWLRKWVNLDNENALRKDVEYYKEKQRRQWEEEMRKRKEADPNFAFEMPHRIYNETDQEGFKAKMYEVRDEFIDENTDEFFRATEAKLEEFFGEGDYIVWKYNKYYENNRNVDNEDLYNWVDDILSDLDNYPGNRDVK